MTLSLRQLIAEYEQITCPITLVCAGNRRKEQNQVRKSKGFSWGAAGVSTSLFTGVAMADLIRKARPKRKARFVCMEGADKLVCPSDTRSFGRKDLGLKLSILAQRLLWHIRQAELGHGPQQGHDVGLQDERRHPPA